MATMLQLIQQATAEMGQPVPNAVSANSDESVVQYLAMLNAVGYELQRQFDWQWKEKEYRFTTEYSVLSGTTTSGSPVVTGISSTSGLSTSYMVTGTGINQDTYIQSVDSASQVTLSQSASASGTVSLNFCKTKYALPSDFDRIVDQTQWDKSKHWRMIGPVTAQQWQWLKSGYIATAPQIRFRIMANTFQIWPPTTSNDYLGFEYQSNAWALDLTGTAKTSFTVDTDTCVFPDRLMVLGLKMKFFETKNFDTQALYRDYTSQLDIAKANDMGSATLSFAPRVRNMLIGIENVPDTNFGS